MRQMYLFVFFYHVNGVISCVINILYFLLECLPFCVVIFFPYSTRIINAPIVLILQIEKQKRKEVSSLPCGKSTKRARKWTRTPVEWELLPLAEFTSK